MHDVRGTILRDVADPAMKRKDIALTYAFGLRQGLTVDEWREINAAIRKETNA
jgi:hypothetical protein